MIELAESVLTGKAGRSDVRHSHASVAGELIVVRCAETSSCALLLSRSDPVQAVSKNTAKDVLRKSKA